MSLSKQSPFIVLLLSLLHTIIQSTSAPTYVHSVCSNTTTFATNSKYHTNLNTLFRSLSSNATSNHNGFYATTAATGTTDAVYGLFLCRGDQNATACSDCVKIATTTDLPKTYCPNRKVAVAWYDQCVVRYSNKPLLGIMEVAPELSFFNKQNITGNQTLFTDILGDTMNDLAIQAANSQTGKKYATKMAKLNGLQSLYALCQCTLDLSTGDCNQCLRSGIGRLTVKLGAQVLQPSCSVRYETYPFYSGPANTPSSPQPKINSTVIQDTSTVFQDTGAPEPTPPPPRSKKLLHIAIVVSVLAVIATMLAVISAYFYIYRGRRTRSDASSAVGSLGHNSLHLKEITAVESLQFEFKTIRDATNNFSEHNILGKGGFGIVYKGMLQNGRQVAVKRLSVGADQGDEEFKTEVLLVAKLQHKNLIRLKGFCIHRQEKLLVYELVPNASLDKVLLDRKVQPSLDWETRYKILLGTARGLLYLHEDSRLKIIHRDLKSSNILLDENMNPKIADFGLARLVGTDQIHADTSKIAGTYGYMAPEYALTGRFSIMSDVYSFGVIALEIVSGHICSSTAFPFEDESLFLRAWSQWKDGAIFDLVDSRLDGNFSREEVTKCIQIGLLCIQEDANKRPTMGLIVSALNGHVVTLAEPEQPYVVSMIEYSSSEKRQMISNTISENTDDITEIYAR